LQTKSDSGHLEEAQDDYKKTRKGLDDLASGKSGQRPIHPRYVSAIVNRLAAEDAIFTADVGTPTVWIARYISMNGKRRMLGSFNHGSMANALPDGCIPTSTAPFPQTDYPQTTLAGSNLGILFLVREGSQPRLSWEIPGWSETSLPQQKIILRGPNRGRRFTRGLNLQRRMFSCDRDEFGNYPPFATSLTVVIKEVSK
jgi:hypothetical protein